MRALFPALTTCMMALILSMIMTTHVSAQGSCTPDCFGTPFGPRQTKVLQLPGGCWVKIVYAQRHACNQYYDVNIVSVTPLTPDCDTLTIQQLVAQATNVLLVDNPMGFPPFYYNHDTCVTNWRVTKGACWGKSANSCGDSVASSCDTNICCLSAYRVCIDHYGNRSVRKSGSSSTGSCDTTSVGCANVCGYSDSTGGGGYSAKGPAINDLFDASGIIKNESSRNDGNASVTLGDVTQDNPGGLVCFTLNVARRTHVSLRLYNRTGKEVARLVDRSYNAGVYRISCPPSRLHDVATYRLMFTGGGMNGELTSMR